MDEEFKEIGHCGGQFLVEIKTSPDGQKQYSVGISHSRPTPASFFAIYAIPPGIPVAPMQITGIGGASDPPPSQKCIPIFIASDSLGCFGHHCKKCNGYWRSKGSPTAWRMTCPYCGLRAFSHKFLTVGQTRYVEECCALIINAIESGEDGEHCLDMDQVADAVEKNSPKPSFFYAEESQQNKYICNSCNHFNDILGIYGYCSSCGIRNDLQEFEEKQIKKIQEKITRGTSNNDCIRDTVSAFDSFVGQYVKQLVNRIPMTKTRKKKFQGRLFHNLLSVALDLKNAFDIDIFDKIEESDRNFGSLMFYRRHIFEHHGGEVTEKYLKESGDTSFRLKQTINETQQSAQRLKELCVKMARNMHKYFHEIFPPESQPIEFHKERIKQQKRGRN